MVVRAIALMVLAIGLAAPAYADATDDAFVANLQSSGINYGAPDRAIQVAKTVVCGTLNDDPATNWPTNEAAYFTGAAIQAYCPQHTFGVPSVPSKPKFHPASMP